MSMWHQWKPYVPVAQRRRNAARQVAALAKKGHVASPIAIEGRVIARTFWGKAWCDNLEHYSDYENRLPRGRTYVRNGSVVDLQIAPTEVKALVSGSNLYRVTIKVAAVPKARWSSICRDCTGAIDSLVELLQGRFSQATMERICREKAGLFPAPAEIEFSCSCPDWASMCKHVAAVLYGVGARLDQEPELLFTLRRVNQADLLARAGGGRPLSKTTPRSARVLASGDLSELFGLEMDGAARVSPPAARRASRQSGRVIAPPASKAPRPGPSAAPPARGARKTAAPATTRSKRAAPRASGGAPGSRLGRRPRARPASTR